ncbi:YajQ family cyclic di-GMP-binding protein [Candidatus Acetothermia bacterium]|nr:YajQ family cyclic di-GMP-binding protein [Candidatus Acetothermia bacterium]MBI3643966.1 YajQ family cyclic di-GMP-binding protein [Candidatus Acetothermia bacterium]
MPSFDIVNRIDMQLVDNAVNNSVREISQRYDFRGSHCELTLDKKTKKINFLAADKVKMDAMREIFIANAVRQKINMKSFHFGQAEPTSAGALKKEVEIKEGIEKEIAQRIVKLVKESKMKVQASIQSDELRVTGKKIDDLQEVIALLHQHEWEVPLQFVNMRS